jgi:hypothetical protein
MTFIARYGGDDCGACEEPIERGQEVEYDRTDRLVHVVCPEVVPSEARATCPTCWMELPLTGVCEDCS